MLKAMRDLPSRAQINWSSPVQRRMRALLVGFLSPASNFAACVPEIPEPTSIEALIAQAALKTLDVPILLWLSGLNVNGCDTSFDTPGQVMPVADLGPIIGTKILWCTAVGDDALQHACHALAGNADIGLQSQAFAREGVHYTENPQPSPAGGYITGKIDRPLLIRAAQTGAGKRSRVVLRKNSISL